MKKNFDLQIQGFSTDSARESLNIARGDFDPTLTAGANRNFSQQAARTNRILEGATTEGPSSDRTTFEAGVSQRVPQTGGTVSLNANTNRSATNDPNSVFNPTFGDSITLTVNQPLLRNAGSTVARANLENAKIGVNIATLNYKSRVLTVIRDTENAYNSLVSARETLRIRQLSLELAQRLYDENTAKRNSGVATDLDVLTAEVGVATARRNFIQGQQAVSNAEDTLLGFFAPGDFTTNPGVVTFTPYNEPSPSFAESYKRARENFPDTLSVEEQIKQLEISLAVAKRNRLPQVNLTASAGYTGKATDEGYWAVIENTPHENGRSWGLGVTYSAPWGRRADKARYRSAAINLNSQKVRLEQLEQSLLVNVRTVVRSVETNLVSVELAAKATELSAKQYELQKARFDAGLSTSRLVLQAQDDLEIARLAELSAKVTLRAAVAELHRLEGTSLQRYNIALP